MKHIAPYLPYKVQMAFIVREEIVKIGTLNNISVNNSDTHPIRYSIYTLNELEHEWMFKPILKPLSYIFKDNFLLEKADDFCIEMIENNKIECLPFGYVQLLLEHHIDIFGLIESGQAIDINTLNK